MDRLRKFDDLNRIEYSADPDEDFLTGSIYRIVDFVDGRWELYGRNYSGTQWYSIGEPPRWCFDKIKSVLMPIAELLKIPVTDDVVRCNNPRSLLETHCTLVEEKFLKVGQSVHNNLSRSLPRVRLATTYLLQDGSLAQLFGAETWGNETETYEDESTTDLYVHPDFRATCTLVIPDFEAINFQLVEYFAEHPEQLHHLDWRKFEELLEAVFRNQGYDTELGPGRRDGGVDLRLIQKDSIGQMVTLVQVKRYSPNNPVKLDAVAALYGVVEAQAANRGLFVTTSRYLPSAKRFAEERNRRLILASPQEVADWCKALSANGETF